MPIIIIALVLGGGYWWYTRPSYKLTFSSTTGNIYLQDKDVGIAIMRADGAIHSEDTQAGLSFIKETLHNPVDGTVKVTLVSPTGVVSYVIVDGKNVVHS